MWERYSPGPTTDPRVGSASSERSSNRSASATVSDRMSARDPDNARARYVLGRVREAQSDTPGAMAEYRRAAEILLAR